jgi:glycosyltransferase involved in cell wall biosynthesis
MPEKEAFQSVERLPDPPGRRAEGGLRLRGDSVPAGDGPLVSIVTVCRNAAETLERTVRSVAEQDHPRVEHIVIDGLSDDATVDLLRDLDRQDLLDYWVSEPDRGIYDAMNKGIRCCRGDIVGICNADDWYHPGAFGHVLRHFTMDADYVFGAVTGGDGKVRHGLHRGVLWRSLQWFPSHTASFFARMAVHKQLGLYSLRYPISSDYEFLLRVLHAGYPGAATRENELVGHFSPGGASEQDVLRSLMDEFLIRRDIGQSRDRILLLMIAKYLKNITRI